MRARRLGAGARVLGALAVVLGALVVSPARAGAQFELGLQDSTLQRSGAGAAGSLAYGAMRTIAGSTIRVSVYWSNVAPGGTRMPLGFHPANPADPGYDWSAVDLAVRTARQRHVHVLLMLFDAPKWAEGPNRPAGQPIDQNIGPGAWDPSPAQFADFARAAARRYGGSFPDSSQPGTKLPRVNLWEIWNEENLPYYLAAPNLGAEYRALLNAGYGAIKAIHSDNVVAVGGLAPVSFLPPLSVSPLKFAADLFCLQRTGTTFVRSRSCPQPAHFDVFAHHPYSLAATPTKHAYRYDDVLVGDMGKIASVVQAADRLHTVAPRIRHQIWVTEYAWFTNPPDKLIGDSEPRAARYVAYSMYELWHSGVTLVIWQTIQDYAGANPAGGGLYTSSGRPKLTLRAFAFPVVASVSGGGGFVWGRAPVSHRVTVVVERRAGHRWRELTAVQTGSDGVFRVRFRARGNGIYRARVVRGPVSLAYDSRPIPPSRTHLKFYSG